MAQTVRDVMTSSSRTLKASDSLATAAKLMRDEDVGTIIVTQGGQVRGIVTDRDIVVRGVAEGVELAAAQLGDFCSGAADTVTPTTTIADAAEIMRMRAVRRLPVVEHDRIIGVVSIDDIGATATLADARTRAGTIVANDD